jgi:hypothetical protein
MASAVRNPCVNAFWFPLGAPLPHGIAGFASKGDLASKRRGLDQDFPVRIGESRAIYSGSSLRRVGVLTCTSLPHFWQGGAMIPAGTSS